MSLSFLRIFIATATKEAAKKEIAKDSVVFWKNLNTGFTSHGSLISRDAAQSAAHYANKQYPFISHICKTISKEQIKKAHFDALDQFSPFKNMP